jgi:regulator of protease activity HflC (stomatin/prohibitin superfamily)
LQAEGKREAAFREAEARERSAEAEAKATTMVSQAIASGDVQAINYFVAQKYIEALKDFANSPNQRLMILPTEVTGVMGSIAGIAELARDSADKQKSIIAAKNSKQP